MRNYKFKIIVLALLSLALGSCSLEEILPDTNTDNNVKTEKDVTALIYGMYAPLNNANGFKYASLKYLFLAGDDLYANGVTELQAISYKEFGAEATSEFWNTFYSVIGNTNKVINILDKLELSESFEKRAYAEAYFIRAFSYYYLVRLYGGVPLRTEVTTRATEFQMPRNTVEEVYEQIFKDFTAAAEGLPLKSAIAGDDVGRATKGAAQGFLAQAYLTRANHLDRENNRPLAETYYQNAINYSDSVILSNQYKLLDDYGKLWGVPNEAAAYDEVLFGIRFSTDASRPGIGSNGSEFAYRFIGASTWNLTGNKADNGGGAAHVRVQPWVPCFAYSGDFGPFPPNAPNPVFGQTNFDYRAQNTFSTRGFNGNLNTVTKQNSVPFYLFPTVPEAPASVLGFSQGVTSTIAKYVDPNGFDSRNHGNDFFVMRFAEIYLIKAEAINELSGPTTDAFTNFNKLRERARKADGTARVWPTILAPGTLNKQTFRKKILDERLVEFLAEGIRWFDLVRMTSHTDNTKTMYDYQWQEFLPTLTPGNPSLNRTTLKWTATGYIAASAGMLKYDPKYKLFPIPTSERIHNPNFGPQNPGW